jgi:hypothetical protein
VQCTQQQTQSAGSRQDKKTKALSATSSSPNEGTDLQTDIKTTGLPTSTTNVRNPKVSAFELDDSRFLPTRFTIGLETFLNSQTPVLNYDVPLDTDFVEIMRCPLNAVLTGASDTVRLEDIELSDASSSERARMYRNNDYFAVAVNAGCSQLTQGTRELAFYDSWAPSGSYRYLIRPCVSSDRLVDTEKLTTRNCSRQIGITQPLKDYVNKRDKEQREFLRKASEASSNILLTLQTAKQHADTFGCFIQWCECGSGSHDQSICQRDVNGVPNECTGGEHGRAVAKAKKAAIVTLVAVATDLLLNAATSGPAGGLGQIKNIVTKPGLGSTFGGGMVLMGYGASLNGMSFNLMFQALATQTADFPRTCAQGVSIDLEMTKYALAVQGAQVEYNYNQCRATAAQAMTSSAAGEGGNGDFSNCPTALPVAPIPEALMDSSTDTGTEVSP